MKYLIIILTLTLSACSVLRGKAIEMEVPQRAAKAVDQYCLNLPYTERIQNREAINDLTQIGDVAVTCQGDPE